MMLELIDTMISIIGLILPVYFIVRFNKWGYLFGILTVWFILSVGGTTFWGIKPSTSRGILDHDWVMWGWLCGLIYCSGVYGVKKLWLWSRKRNKRTRLIIGGVTVVVFVVAWALGPRLLRCYTYFKLVSEPSMLARLSVKPRIIEMPLNTEGSVFSVGYAELFMPPESIRSVMCEDSMVVMECNEGRFVFMPPISMTYENFKDESIKTPDMLDPLSQLRGEGEKERRQAWERMEGDRVVGRLMREMVVERYNWSLKVVSTMPKKYYEIFLQPPEAFKEYMWLAISKGINFCINDEIAIVEAEYVNGIIYFGRPKEPGKVHAEIYSKKSNIGQGIHLCSASLEKSKKDMLSLVSSYRFVIPQVPDEDALHSMIVREIEKHDKFKVVEKLLPLPD